MWVVEMLWFRHGKLKGYPNSNPLKRCNEDAKANLVNGGRESALTNTN